MCQFGTVRGIQDTRKQVGMAQFLREPFRLMLRRCGVGCLKVGRGKQQGEGARGGLSSIEGGVGADSGVFGDLPAPVAPKVQPSNAVAPGMEIASNGALVGV